MKRLLFATIALTIITLSCEKSPCSDSVKATLQDATGIGGCEMVIELENGKYLEPVNINDFNITPKDGQELWVPYHLKPNGVTNCMMGDVVIIDCIGER